MNRNQVLIRFCSNREHVCQVLTGLYRVYGRWGVQFKLDTTYCNNISATSSAVVIVEYEGKVIVFDVEDGYQYPEQIRYLYNHCDFYFKRSYNKAMNESLGLADRIFPFGFNYYVTLPWIPIYNGPNYRKLIEYLLYPLRGLFSYFGCKKILYHFLRSEDVFSLPPTYLVGKNAKIFFLNRLWPGEDELNNLRIQIIRQLREMDGIQFIGGLVDTPLSRDIAPDLIVGGSYTIKGNYTRLMHESDICIGSTGLHRSIGWKVGEYVAASKAIIAEKFYYELPGDWMEGANYLPFETVDECIDQVKYLLNHPTKIAEMQQRNYEYYTRYLKPEQMVKNAMRIVDGMNPDD